MWVRKVIDRIKFVKELYPAQVVYKPSAGLAHGVLNLEFVLGFSFPASSVRRRDGAATPDRSRAEIYHFI
jgi:hypothetical protein